MPESPWNREKRVLAFAVGAGLWLLALLPLFVFHGSSNSSSAFVRSVGGPAIAVGIILCLALWICSAFGWRSFPIGGGGGTQLKLIVVAVLGATIVGLVPVAYWSGACLIRWLDRLRDPFPS